MRDDIERAMQRAIECADGARFQAPPNPWVGCVILSDGAVVGEGATSAPGGPHAEIIALERAGERARGATVVVTLEPCAHDGRTGPCADALIAAGVACVVVALEDPDVRVAGRGIARLRDAGVDVVVGVAGDAVTDQLRSYLHHRRTGLPFVVLKSAISLDGRTATAAGESKWITGVAARADAHWLRAQSQAVVFGAGTVLADDPSGTVRDASGYTGPQPTRVICDARGRVPATAKCFNADAPTVVYTASETDADAWKAAGAEIIAVPTLDGGLDLSSVVRDLGARGVLQCVIEGGPTLAGSFIAGDLVDSIVTYVSPRVLGAAGRPFAEWVGPTTLESGLSWQRVEAVSVGPDLRVTYLRSA